MAVQYMESCLPLPLNEKLFTELLQKAKDWALMHGAAMRSKNNFSFDSLDFAPFTLLPSTFPRDEFEKAVNIQITLNELIHKVAYDHEFLLESLKYTIKVDDFTGRLFKLYETVRQEGFTQEFSLGLLRSDYLLDSPDKNKIKQVEINSISTSLAGLGTEFSLLHRYVLREMGRSDLLNHLPENKALSGLCSGLIDAWKIYNNPSAIILFVIEDVSYNICDQRFHEFEIRESNPEINIIRRTLTEIHDSAILGDRKELLIENLEVAVVYYRAAYEPLHYPTEKEWDARLLMERSLAIKCPSIQYHLAGTKKVQQALAKPNVLEKYLNDPKKVDSIREIFTGLYSLDFDKFGDEAVELALNDPEKYVLKPQREGGGNNIYGADLKIKLHEMRNIEERTAWILMERIIPPIQQSYIIRPGTEVKAKEPHEVVSELGIFGVILGDANTIVVNKQVGHMLRTKSKSANEGGVAAGLGCLDSPFLID